MSKNEFNEKIPLKDTEFAIKEGAVFNNTAKKAKIKYKNKDRVIEITLKLTYVIREQKDLLEGPQEDVNFNRWGLFKKEDEHESAIMFKDIALRIHNDKTIILRSENNDFDLETNGEKGEHGRSFI